MSLTLILFIYYIDVVSVLRPISFPVQCTTLIQLWFVDTIYLTKVCVCFSVVDLCSLFSFLIHFRKFTNKKNEFRLIFKFGMIEEKRTDGSIMHFRFWLPYIQNSIAHYAKILNTFLFTFCKSISIDLETLARRIGEGEGGSLKIAHK